MTNRPPIADLAAADLAGIMPQVGVSAVYRRRGEHVGEVAGDAVTISLGAVGGSVVSPQGSPPTRMPTSQRRTVPVFVNGLVDGETYTEGDRIGSSGHVVELLAGDTFQVDGAHLGLARDQVVLKVPDHGPRTAAGSAWAFDAEVA